MASGPPVRSSSPRCSSRAWGRCGTWSCTRRGGTSSALAHVGHAEHRVVGDLVEADPQAQVVGREAPLAPKASRLGTRMSSSSEGPGGSAGRTGRTTAGPGGRPSSRRSWPPSSAAWPGASGRAWPPAGRRRHPGPGRARRPPRPALGRAQRARELLEQGPVVVERALGPVAPVDRHHRELAAGDGGRQAGHVGDVQLGHAGQLLELDALERVDVGSLVLSVATARARLRAASHGTPPPPWPNSLARSPKRGKPSKGLGRVAHGIHASAGGTTTTAASHRPCPDRPRGALARCRSCRTSAGVLVHAGGWHRSSGMVGAWCGRGHRCRLPARSEVAARRRPGPGHVVPGWRAARCRPGRRGRRAPGRPGHRRRQAPRRARRRRAAPGAGRCRRPHRPPPTTSTWPAGCSTPPATRACPRGGAVVERGLRRLGQQPGAAHRGRPAAPQPRVPLRRRAGRDRAPDRRVARRPPGHHRAGPAPGAGRRRRRPRLAGPGPAPRPGRARAPTSRRCSSSTSTTWPRRSTWPAPPARRGLQRGARRVDPGDQVRSLIGAPPKVPLPERVASRSCAGASGGGSARPRRAAALHAAPVGRRQRPAAGRGWAPGRPTRRRASRPTRPARWATMSPRAARRSASRSPASGWWAWRGSGGRPAPLAAPLTAAAGRLTALQPPSGSGEGARRA